MSFGRELKDFVEGFKTGEDIKKGWTERKYREQQIEKERLPTEAEKNAPGGPLSGSTSGAPAIAETSSSTPGTPGDPRYREAISSIESGGKYDALGPWTGDPQEGRDRAYGRYQVMGKNVPAWTKAALGKAMTPEEFLADPKAQDAVFDHIFGGYVQQFGERGAAQAWFGGPGSVGKDNRKDVLGTTIKGYGDRFIAALSKTPASTQTAAAGTGAIAEPAAGGVAKVTQPAGQPASTTETQKAVDTTQPAQPAAQTTFIDSETAKKMDPKIVRVTERAARDNPGLFGFNPLTKTLRTPEEQAEYVKKGWSKTQHSKHLEGKAVDLVPINPNTGKPDPTYTAGYGKVHDAMTKAARDEGVTDLDWGGNWKSFKDLPHYQVSMLNQPQGDPNAPQPFEDQQTMFTASGGVIPEPQYFQAGGTPLPPNPVIPDPNPSNPSNTAGGGDRYSSFRNYTQKIQPSATPASSFVPRRVGQAMPGVTYAPPMQMVDGMTPSQLAYKQQLDKLAAQRAAKPAPVAAPAAAPAPVQRIKPSPAWGMDPYGAGRGQINPLSGFANPTWSHRAEGGMVYADFAEGGAIPDGSPEPQAPAPSSNADPYNSEYWTPVNQAKGYADGGYVDPMVGTDIPSPYTPRPPFRPPYAGELPEDYAASRQDFELQRQGDQMYRPDEAPVIPEIHYPTVAQDQNYIYRNRAGVPLTSPYNVADTGPPGRMVGQDRLPPWYRRDVPPQPHRPYSATPYLVPGQETYGSADRPPPAGQPQHPHTATPNLIPGQETYGSADRRPGQPHRPYSPTPNLIPGQETYGSADRPSPGLAGPAPHPTPRPSTSGPDKKKTAAPKKADKTPDRTPQRSRYNDPYEREKERFATRDRFGNLLPGSRAGNESPRRYAEGGAIPEDPYQNEQSMFARPAPQAAPQRAAPPQAAPQQAPPPGVDRTQTASIPPGSGGTGDRSLGAPSTHKPTPTLLSDVSTALHHGIQFLTGHFGLQGEGAVPTPEGQQTQADGAQRFASGEGASTPQEVNAIDDKIDPGRQMPEGDRQMQRLANVVQFYLERGRKDDAAAAAAGLMQYGAQRTQQYGSVAAAAYRKYQQTHDPADLQKTTQILQAAYSMIPNGGDYGVTINPQTHELNVAHTDDQGQVTNTPISADQLPGIIKGVQDKSLYWQQIQLLADPEGVHQREREKLQSEEWTRQHGITSAEEVQKEGRTAAEWSRQHGVLNAEDIEKEKRQAEAEAKKEERAAAAKEAEHQRGLVEEADKEKRANQEADRRALLAAGIERAKKTAEDHKTVDWDAVNPVLNEVYDAQASKDQNQINQKMSKLWDSLPKENREKVFTSLTDLTPSQFKYLPKTANAMMATGDKPPDNYPGKQAGDVVKKAADPQGNPIWVVQRGNQSFAIPAG